MKLSQVSYVLQIFSKVEVPPKHWHCVLLIDHTPTNQFSRVLHNMLRSWWGSDKHNTFQPYSNHQNIKKNVRGCLSVCNTFFPLELLSLYTFLSLYDWRHLVRNYFLIISTASVISNTWCKIYRWREAVLLCLLLNMWMRKKLKQMENVERMERELKYMYVYLQTWWTNLSTEGF